MNRDIIIAPLISEKSMNAASFGKFTFKVFKKQIKNRLKRGRE